MAATLVSNLDDIATVNTAPTTSNSNISFADYNTDPTIVTSNDVAPPHQGQTVQRFSTTTGIYATLRWGNNKWTGTPTGNTFYHRYYFRLSFAPTTLMAISGHQDDNTIGTALVMITTGRRLRIYDASMTTRGTMTTVIPVGQWVRIETRTVLASSGGLIQVRLYLSPESTTPTEDFTSSGGDTLGGLTGLTWVGIGDAYGGDVATHYYADSAWSDTTWVGPASGSATVKTGSVSMTATHTTSATSTGIVVRQGTVAMTATHTIYSQAAVQTVGGQQFTTFGGTLVSPGDARTIAELLKEDSGGGRVDDDVIAAILNGVTQVTRRAEIYEADGKTLWIPSIDTPRLIDGEVSVDYSRDERRTLDCTFDNSDGVLDHNPNGFWYDKVIKCFRGIKYQNHKLLPRILIIQDDTTSANRIFLLLRALKYSDITVKTSGQVTTLEDLYGYDVVVAASGNSTISTGNSTLLQAAYAAGYNILTAGNQNTETQLPGLIAATVAKTTTQAWEINQPITDSPVRMGWGGSVLIGNTSTGRHVVALASAASPVAAYTWAGVGGYTGAYSINAMGGRWLHLQLVISPQTNTSLRRLLQNSVNWLYSYAQEREWEIQIGEFMIDKISHDVFPHTIKVTGRDYTKKIMLSKFKQSLTFSAGTSIDTLVRALGANAGITKFFLNGGAAALQADMTFARGDDRWKAIKDCCTASSIEVFFNATGHLTTRPFKDPVTAPTTFTLSLRPEDANLTELGIESSDTSIHNVVVVTAETSDGLASGTFYQATATNNDSSSATAVSRIGERTFTYETAAASSNSQCQQIANNLLKVMALEEYTLNFSALVFPWADAGDIVLFKDKAIDEDIVQGVGLTTIDPAPYRTAVSDDSPVVWFHMDDASGQLVDSVAGITATPTGTLGYGAAGLTAEIASRAITFTTTAMNYAEGTSNDILSPPNITVEALIKTNGITGNNRIIQYGADTSWRLCFETGQLVWEVWQHSKSAYTWAPDTNVHHIAATYDAATGYSFLFVDGVQVASQTSGMVPGYANTTTDGFRIGQKPTSATTTDGWNGTIDEIAVYDRVLPLADIQQHNSARNIASTTSTTSYDPLPMTPEILPDRYLLTSVTIPLGLQPMGGVAKRVTIVAPLEGVDNG
jgi:hypothetical protein